MKAKLLEFEHDGSSYQSSREKAFYATLRSLLLEITTSRSPKEAGLRIVAAHKWYVKHRPRGQQEDPAVFAALATSLSLAKTTQAQALTSSHSRDKSSFVGATHSPNDFFAAFSSKASELSSSSLLPPPQSQRINSKTNEKPADKYKSSLPVVLMPMESKPLVPKTRGPSASYRESVQALADSREISEREEMEALRRRYAIMDSSALTSSVERQVELWSLNRARVEEEIIRRQEASRYASPSIFSSTQKSSDRIETGSSTISAYQHIASSSSKGEDPNDAGRAGGGSLSYLTSIMVSARDARHRAASEYESEKHKIANRMPALSADSLSRALQPVADRSYLECIAKLPRNDRVPDKEDVPVGSKANVAVKSVSKKKKL